MYAKIKNEIKEIVQIVNECPASLQERCFEVLLSHLLMENSPPVPGSVQKKTENGNVVKPEKNKTTPEAEPVPIPTPIPVSKPQAKSKPKPKAKPVPTPVLANNGTEAGVVQLTDFHSKVQSLLEVGSISLERINDLYHKEDGLIKPLYTDLATDQPHVSQICLGLLSAFENSFFTGAFEFEVDRVRARCKEMECYDAENFSTHFKNVKQLFEEGAEFEEGAWVKLSSDGMNAVLEVLTKIK